MPKKAEKSMANFQFLNKLQSLPNVNTQLNKILHKYHCIKHSAFLVSVAFWFCEMYLKLFFKAISLLFVFLPEAVWKLEPVVIVDEFACHQLTFLEQKLSKKTGTVFKYQNSFISKLFQTFNLFFRLCFIWPRLAIFVFASIWEFSCKEVKDDLGTIKNVFSGPPSQVRRTTTRIRCKRSTSSPSQRKRKHEEEIEGEVEQYLFVNESYQSENDPDYEIGETTCDDNASSDEAKTDDELNDDAKCILCKDSHKVEDDAESGSEASQLSSGNSESDVETESELEPPTKKDLISAMEETKDNSPSGKVEERGKLERRGSNSKSPICQRG